MTLGRYAGCTEKGNFLWSKNGVSERSLYRQIDGTGLTAEQEKLGTQVARI